MNKGFLYHKETPFSQLEVHHRNVRKAFLYQTDNS